MLTSCLFFLNKKEPLRDVSRRVMNVSLQCIFYAAIRYSSLVGEYITANCSIEYDVYTIA